MSGISRLELRHPTGRTHIAAGAGALAEEAGALRAWLSGRKVFVVADPVAHELHGALLEPVVSAAAETVTLVVPEGERAKELDEARRLWSQMLVAGGKRDSRVLAFGGGSTGDLAGFVAGGFLRGVAYCQVPTTLLAQVDASVGGKTGVNLPEAKNSVGLFHHPFAVVADSRVLATLPPPALRSGLVEVIKMAALLDLELLGRVEADLEGLLAGDPATLAPVVAGAVAAKAGVVERDPDERDERRLLNFGHTLGHGLEAALGYAGLEHGEAVAYGMLFAIRLAVARGFDETEAERLRRLLGRLGLPPLPEVDRDVVLVAIGRDKKAREGGLAWVLPERLGRGTIRRDLEPEKIAVELDRFLASPWS